MPEIDRPDSIRAICHQSRPCNRWRTCARCAARRQKTIADAAEYMHSVFGNLRWHIIHPETGDQAGLQKAKTNWLRSAQPEASIWTVEQSKKTGTLHWNVITPAETIYTPKRGHYWTQEIAGNVRNVAAYISKPSQYPRPDSYTGNLYGTTGTIWQALSNQAEAPIVAAAALQYALDSHKMLERAAWLKLDERQRNERKFYADHQKQDRKGELTRADARTIAEKWLPDLLEFKKRNRQKTPLEIAQEFCEREKG